MPGTWIELYNRAGLVDAPRHFATIRHSPFMLEYLKTVLDCCPESGRSLEAGVGNGFGAIWLSLRGCLAEGIDSSPQIVERARAINNALGGEARFRVQDLFSLEPHADGGEPPYDVIHHQGVLEHFGVAQIRAALARQVALANRVVFSVPSVYYPYEPEFGDERLLTVDLWKWILSPFEVEHLEYYGDPPLGAREHVLCVLRGSEVTPELTTLIKGRDSVYEPGITAIVLARNEERNLEACLERLKWADQLIVCNMESSDRTCEIAEQFGAIIVNHPVIENFDRSRNAAAMRATKGHVLFVDADEQLAPGFDAVLKRLIAEADEQFGGMLIPMRHHFAGKPLECLYPGYTAPRLLVNGKFYFNARPHSGCRVDGEITKFPAEPRSLAVDHYSYPSVASHLEKINRYTDAEAANMYRDGMGYDWRAQVGAWIHHIWEYMDAGNASQDGPHGWIYAFQSGMYRAAQYSKLFELRFKNNNLQPQEMGTPRSTREFLLYALATLDAHEHAGPARSAVKVRVGKEDAATGARPASRLLWTGPLADPSGTGEESRNFVLALEAAGLRPATQTVRWSADPAGVPDAELRKLEEMANREVEPGFVQIIQDFPRGFVKHPDAGLVIARTMFETDRAPEEWVGACDRMDYVWVPSEHGKRAFASSGVDENKIVVIPGCIEVDFYRQEVEPLSAASDFIAGRYAFMSVFDWSLHKGWDVLLRGFLEAFQGREEVCLILKVWSTMSPPARMKDQAAEFVNEVGLGDLAADGRVLFMEDKLSRSQLLQLYRACNTFVLPTRGEGAGRPYLEAMASKLFVIGSAWGGNCQFMTGENSALLDCDVVPVPERGWKEIPTYRGHRWAEPSLEQLKEHMVWAADHPEEAAKVGAMAQKDIAARFSRARIGALMKAELERVTES